MISELAIRTIAYGAAIPDLRRIANFNQVARTAKLLKQLDINVLLDVGANRGTYAKHLRSAGFKGHIFSFEPTPSDCAKIEAIARHDEKWLALNYALGAENGRKQFNLAMIGGHTVLSSFLPIKHNIPTKPIDVEIRRLDDALPALIAEISNPRVFLKMDTQGFDEKVIEGAETVLPLVQGLQSEISVTPLYDEMIRYTSSLENYHRLGFQLVDLFVVNRTEDGAVLEYDCIMKR
jgi:FkbM family methyltransferase